MNSSGLMIMMGWMGRLGRMGTWGGLAGGGSTGALLICALLPGFVISSLSSSWKAAWKRDESQDEVFTFSQSMISLCSVFH